MKEQNSSLIERLKICWSVLTTPNYVYFGIANNPFIDMDDGFRCNKIKIKSYSCVRYNYEFETKNGKTNLHDFVWKTIEDLAKIAQQGKV